MLGQQGYGFLADGRLFATYSKDGSSRLVVANVTNGDGPATDIQEYDMQDGLPMMFGGIVASASNDLYFIGGSPSTPTSVFKWSLDSPGRDAEQLACSSTLQFSPEIVSIPKQIEFPTTMGKTAFGYYYAPCNEKYKCTTEQAPPLLVKAHGGPTACTGTSFNAVIQYWTSRGFAVLDVDYGGSTGYGRDYRRRLRGAWGIVDVDDVCAGAQYLVQQGLADAKRLCIDGGSAGGYTTLSALAFRDTFRAGTSLYGIGDLSMLAGDTHKFESRYLDGLVGEYPKDMAVYKARSPIESVDTLNCPILLLQGVEDKVVPPNQAESMHQALLKKGLPTCLKLYEGEQHGFRQAKNIEDALDSELAFYGKIYGIPVPNAIEIKIDNLP
jgi:dipeptidyl aminopeptidase/acylaminoacyl peptidase